MKITKVFNKWLETNSSRIIQNTLKVIGAYGIIVVFAQDIGIKTGCKQAFVSHNIVMQILIFTSVAYSVTDDFYQSLSGTLIYYILKYIYSKKRTQDVSEDEIKGCINN